jgi:SP family arabinose:H+ symporter-like MFS transporter
MTVAAATQPVARRRLTGWLIGVGVVSFSVVDAIGEATTFFRFAVLCAVTFAFVWYLVPETQGRSLEEIQTRWAIGGDRMLEDAA